MSNNIIRVLDETTANKIAAGEVVERPSSVIKELVENSLDAHGSNIEVEIAEGGVRFIRVTDNGVGMSYQDAQLAILRHATSKISSAEDLASILSLGFRGEALPSIAAVSKFALTTRLHTETMAAYVEVHGGSIVDTREAGGNVGTTITVSDLFFNTPARQKFLKSPSAESSHIHDIIGKLALSNPSASFKLINNQKLVLSTPGNGQLTDTMASLYGYKISSEILPVDYSVDEISISGYIGKPTLLKSNRQWQTFIVNSRVINSRVIAKAIDNAYHSLLPKSGYPLVVLHITILTDNVDVNVHPQKSEIKFSDEQKIYRAVYHAITGALTSVSAPEQLAATIIPATPISIPRPSEKQYAHYQRQDTGSRFVPQPAPSLWREQAATPFIMSTTAETGSSYKEKTEAPSEIPQPLEESIHGESITVLHPLGQVGDCYIVAMAQDELYIIDQHAAHERILYERLSKNTDRIPAQQLLVPQFLDFDNSEIDLIAENNDLFIKLGFTLELVGPNTMRLIESPADIPLSEIETILRQILSAIHDLHDPSAQTLRHACLQIAACRAAIKAGEPLNMRQMQALVDELCSTELPYTCPHGRPAIVRFTTDNLAKLFKRT